MPKALCMSGMVVAILIAILFLFDLAAPSAIKVGPPVVIEPLAPVDKDTEDSGSTGSTADEEGDSPSLLPDTSDDGDGGGGTPLEDVTDTLLGKKKASLPGEPVKKVTDTLNDGVVDPLLGDILP